MSQTEDLQKLMPLLHAAGLADTARQFPDDVLTAASVVARLRATFVAPEDNTQDVWPPMQVKGTPCIG